MRLGRNALSRQGCRWYAQGSVGCLPSQRWEWVMGGFKGNKMASGGDKRLNLQSIRLRLQSLQFLSRRARVTRRGRETSERADDASTTAPRSCGHGETARDQQGAVTRAAGVAESIDCTSMSSRVSAGTHTLGHKRKSGLCWRAGGRQREREPSVECGRGACTGASLLSMK